MCGETGELTFKGVATARDIWYTLDMNKLPAGRKRAISRVCRQCGGVRFKVKTPSNPKMFCSAGCRNKNWRLKLLEFYRKNKTK